MNKQAIQKTSRYTLVLLATILLIPYLIDSNSVNVTDFILSGVVVSVLLFRPIILTINYCINDWGKIIEFGHERILYKDSSLLQEYNYNEIKDCLLVEPIFIDKSNSVGQYFCYCSIIFKNGDQIFISSLRIKKTLNLHDIKYRTQKEFLPTINNKLKEYSKTSTHKGVKRNTHR